MNWKNHRVVTFNGSSDTRKGTLKSYSMLSLGQIWDMSPGVALKTNARAIIPSSYNDPDAREHKVQREKGTFSCICLDIDKGNHELGQISRSVIEFFGKDVATFIYSSSSATENEKKYRVIIPLEQQLNYGEWLRLTEASHAFMAKNSISCDPALARAGQPVFLPNVPPDKRDNNGLPMFYLSEPRGGIGATLTGGMAPLCLAMLQKQKDAKKAAYDAAKSPRKVSTQSGGGSIEQFNNAHPLSKMLASYGYEQSPFNESDWRSPYQTSKSFATRAFNDDAGSEYFVTLSGSDAEAGIGKKSDSGSHWGDSFDLFVHFENRGDFQAALTAVSNSKSDIKSPQPGRFHLRTAKELSNLPPVQWLIRGILPAEGVAAIYGPPGSGKSFFVLDMMGAVARGDTWCGYKTRQCTGTYIGLEGEAGIAQRVQANEKWWGPLPVTLRFTTDPLNLMTAQDIEDLASEIDRIGGGNGIVCIDTLNRASPGADENDSKDMGVIIEAAKTLQRKVGGLIILIHHTGKDAQRGLRGHSSLQAALDVAIEVGKNNGQFSWQIKKSKDGRDDYNGAFRLETVHLEVDEADEPVTSCVIVMEKGVLPISKPFSPNVQHVVNAYVAVAPKFGEWQTGQFRGLSGDAWRAGFYEISMLDSLEAKRKAFSRARNDLVSRGVLAMCGDLYLLTIPATADLKPSLHVVGQTIAGLGILDKRDNSRTITGLSQVQVVGQDRTSL
jgi:hypothetical protein